MKYIIELFAWDTHEISIFAYSGEFQNFAKIALLQCLDLMLCSELIFKGVWCCVEFGDL